MNACKYLAVIATLAFSTALHAAASFVSHHEPLVGIDVRSGDQTTVAAAPLSLRFEAMGRQFDMELVPNDRVLGALPATVAYQGIAAYRGRLANNQDSWARIVMFDGMPRGLVWDGTTMFAIEAPGDSAADIDAPVMYRLADLHIAPGMMTCDSKSIPSNGAQAYAAMKGELGSIASQAPGAVSEITVSVIGDSMFTAAQGGSAGAAAAITARFNNIDGYFSEQVGVQLNVQLIETFDAANDPFDGTLNPGELLDQLSEYRLQTPAHSSLGLTHLYTGRNFSTSTVGVAWRGALCDSYFSAGLSEGRAGLTTDSLIAAHEIGHNFGAEHDGQPGSSCPSEPETYIMAPSVNGNSEFSACSISVMQAEAAGARCVVALPAVDAAIRQNSPVSTVLLGANTVIDYEVSINGTLSASDVVADIALPNVLALDSISASSGSCTSGAGTASCSFGDLPGLSRHTVTISATPVAVGAGTLSASVNTSDTDERPVNDQESVQVTVDPAVDLVVNQPVTAAVFVDTSTTVTATLENRSTLTATSVALSVTLDNGLQASAASWSLGTCTVAPQQIDCQAGSFAANSSASLSITATARTPGMQNVAVSITSAEADADPSNNSASRGVNVVTPQSDNDSGGGGPTSPLLLLALALAGARGRRTA